MKIKQDEIQDEGLFCPYCYDEKDFDDHGCCGESFAHFELGYVINGEVFLESEIEIKE